MATEARVIVLTKLAQAQITEIYTEIRMSSKSEAEAIMDDFLDVVFDEIKHFPAQFPICEGMRKGSGDYRIGSLYGGYRVIFQVFRSKVLILLVMHESELPF